MKLTTHILLYNSISEQIQEIINIQKKNAVILCWVQRQGAKMNVITM